MIGVVADDITGANDIGIMFAKMGLIADVYHYRDAEEARASGRRPDVLILDTDARFDDAQTAYAKTHEATRTLMSLGVKRFYNKTCSVFRGNVGAYFDAMLDALQASFAVIVLGFPKNGRITKNGIHYVHGKPLAESEFRNDPMHPMKESGLVRILQPQTRRKAASVSYEIVRQGPERLRQELESLRAEYNYVILDVLEQADLSVIAEAVGDARVICGSSALAEELARRIERRGAAAQAERPACHPEKGMLIAAGSLMPQTAAQISHMKERGAETIELDTLQIFDADRRTFVIAGCAARACASIDAGKTVIVHTAGDAEAVRLTKAEGARRGLSAMEISRLVSGAMAEIVHTVVHETGQYRFVIAGGDTSASVCRRLGVKGMTVWKEIQPGLPSCVSVGKQPMMFALKSGSFGTPDFFEAALAHLKEY